MFQATPKAVVALKSGRILSPLYDSMCGVSLQPRETYVITGNCTHMSCIILFTEFIKKNIHWN